MNTIVSTMTNDSLELVKSGIVLYLQQQEFNLFSTVLFHHEENIDSLQQGISSALFTCLSKLFHEDKNGIYSFIKINQNLHIRLERISNGQPIYDSLELQIPKSNKIFALGNTEKSLLSFTIVHVQILYASLNDESIDPEFMYRRYLHLGKKPETFIEFISHPGSMLWHALYSDYLPQQISNTLFYSSEYWPQNDSWQNDCTDTIF